MKEATYTWIATYYDPVFSNEGKQLIASSSLLMVQDFVIKKCDRMCKQTVYPIEVIRKSKHNKIRFTFSASDEYIVISRVRTIVV